MNRQEAAETWAGDRSWLEARGISLPLVQSYLPEEFLYDYDLAADSVMGMDAQPLLSATEPNSAIPAIFTTMIDPTVIQVVWSPSEFATIMDEERRGTWVDDTFQLPITESAGEVSSYGDMAENGMVTANINWPQRQAYLFQVIKEYGERELARMGAARINWVAELDRSAALILNKFSNLSYAFGIRGLQNYGLLNDPNLPASITPALKAWGGTSWYNSSGQIAATANEIFADIENLYAQVVSQSQGLVNRKSRIIFAMSPQSDAALTTTNSFNVNVYDLIKKNFPNSEVMTAVQYGALNALNPQGITGGNFMQLIVKEVEGQKIGFVSFNEKMRAHKLIPMLSAYKQKISAGTWGCVLRQTFSIASMLGI